MGTKRYNGVSKGYKGRNLDFELLTPSRSYQDGVPLDINAMMGSLKSQLLPNQKPISWFPCPVCEYPTGIYLHDTVGAKQERKCTNCHNLSIFIKTIFGNWKIKSIMGNEFVTGKKRVFRNKVL